MKRTFRILSLLLPLLLLLSLSSCAETAEKQDSPAHWRAGFGMAEIPLPDGDAPLYIAGYHNGRTITGVRDLQAVRALWLDAGGDGTLLLAVDCVGLAGDTIDGIRAQIEPLCAENPCTIHVIATHDHAGIDTLGLWGPVAQDGKNPDFMKNLVSACESAAQDALADRRIGKLYRSDVGTENLQRDSREPIITDSTLHILRFEPDDGSAGIRLLSYGAHAESLRGDNTMVSRDYPGLLCDLVTTETGDRALFLPGAVGGLVMTRELADPFDAEENLRLTASALADYALSDAEERALAPELSDTVIDFTVPLDNTVFLYYEFLGILGNPAMRGGGETGYSLRTRLSLIRLGDCSLLLLPGEIFPELVYGGGRENPSNPTETDPPPLAEILAAHGIGDFFVIGLADDELGYIIPPSDFLTDERAPYLEAARPADGSRHYEETNSVGKDCARRIAEALEKLLKQSEN